jgi:hypothetical protein
MNQFFLERYQKRSAMTALSPRLSNDKTAASLQQVFMNPSKARALLGGIVGGGTEWYLNRNSPDPLAQAAAALGGASSGAFAAYHPRGWNMMTVPKVLGGLFAPRAMEALNVHNALSRISLSDESAAGRFPGMAAKGLLGAGALYALYQLGRAARNVGDGKPLTSVQNEVHTGEGGGGGSAVPPAININMPEGFGAPPAAAPGQPQLTNGDGSAQSPSPGLGTLKVTLPTRHPNDHETVVEMPLENVGLSQSIYNKIRRDTKRRLRAETDARTVHKAIGDSMTVPDEDIPALMKVSKYACLFSTR